MRCYYKSIGLVLETRQELMFSEVFLVTLDDLETYSKFVFKNFDETFTNMLFSNVE